MSAQDPEFAALLQRVRDGDRDALGQIALTYERDLRIAARTHLGPALRPYLDSIDLVQSVHRSLLRNLRDQNVELDGPNHLIALALTMVRRKIARQWRRHRRQQRLDGSVTAEPVADVLLSLSARTTDPAQSLEVREAMTRLCRDLDPIDRELLELRLQGWTTAEVAHQTGHSPEALRIRLFRLRKRLVDERVAAEWL